MGLGAQLIAWPIELVDALVDRGFLVIRYDNRDVGLSTKFDGDGGADFMAQFLAGDRRASRCEAPYLLTDMAADGIGLLDHLGIESAHVVGASMGGMIAQTIAIEHPSRCARSPRSCPPPATPDVGQPTPEAMQALLSPVATDRDEAIARSRRDEPRSSASPVHFDEAHGAQAGRGGLRPLLQPGRHRPPAARHRRVGQPGRGPARSSTSRPS